MKPQNDSSTGSREVLSRRLTVLETLTAGVLVLVLVCLAWLVVVTNQPEWGHFFSVQVEVAFILVLLASALILVSILALFQIK